MIPKHTIDEIFDKTDIIEVIGDFVHLKKSGSNYKGLSPFVNEKTPSFMVSPAKGIFKDFSSGKGGNAVTFLMEHEHFGYVEALKWLAAKYNIEIEERERTPQEVQAENERESLFLINQFANEYFQNTLLNTEEGKSVGYSYFKERGFSDATIKTFDLGYSPDQSQGLINAAKHKGYDIETLIKVGLAKEGRNGHFDFFRGRVIFPIHNLTGRILGFGGRTLRNDKKTAKYFNSPESLIYNKSKILYGLYQAKNEIIKKDECFLVEGYTDVISLHQAGIKNVVSSSGTSLTEDQIRLINRYTKNVTILYDGDAAGIKASFRGIDLILEQGLNVQVVLFPDGEDPDSFAKNNGITEVEKYLAENKKDFISFKANVLLSDTQHDPIKRAETIKDIVKSIAIIPDSIVRSVFIQETSNIFDISEKAVLNEVNKIVRASEGKKFQQKTRQEEAPTENTELVLTSEKEKTNQSGRHTLKHQEKDLVRLMISYGNQPITILVQDENGNDVEAEYPLSQYIIEELLSDDLSISNENYLKIFDEFYEGLENGLVVSEQHFLRHEDQNLSRIVVDITERLDLVSENWTKRHMILPAKESTRLKEAAEQSVGIFKMRVLENMILDIQLKLQELKETQKLEDSLKKIQGLTDLRNAFASKLGMVITR